MRPTGRTSMGVIGINLAYDDEIIGMQLQTQGSHLLFVSENGLGKRTSIDEFSVQHRGGKGVKCYKITEKTGNLIGVKAVNEDNEVMLITTEGIIIRTMCEQISEVGRVASGVKLMDIDKKSNVKVASIAKVRESNDATTQDQVLERLEAELLEEEKPE